MLNDETATPFGMAFTKTFYKNCPTKFEYSISTGPSRRQESRDHFVALFSNGFKEKMTEQIIHDVFLYYPYINVTINRNRNLQLITFVFIFIEREMLDFYL